jgi:hypothetical protein
LLQANKAKPPPPPKEKAVVINAAQAPTHGYVPPPPAAGPKITAPAGMPPAKLFPISTTAPPATMSFPGLQSAPSAAPVPASSAPGATVVTAAPVEDAGDGFTPEERRKNQLEEDPAFKKYLMMKRMKIPLAGIRAKIRGEGLY